MVLFRHGIGAVAAEIHEPKFLDRRPGFVRSPGVDYNMVSIHPLHHFVAVEVEPPAQPSPLTQKLWKGVVDRITDHPAHIMLLDVAFEASPAQHYQKEFHVKPTVVRNSPAGSLWQSVQQGDVGLGATEPQQADSEVEPNEPRPSLDGIGPVHPSLRTASSRMR